jgi:hypothetical protein
MGLSFHDEPSLEEAVSGLRFEAADPNAVPETGSISLDGSLRAGPHDPNAIPEMTSVEERRDDDIGGDDDIQIVPIKSTDSSDEILQINA